MRILTIAGSLRAGSSNAALLDAAALVTPSNVTFARYEDLAALPPFNPDLDDGALPLPQPVEALRAAIGAADAVLISSPEYAHGVPGVLKNALDWLVSGPEMVGKRVGLLSASSASRFAHPQLLETLRTMSANVVASASITIDIPRRGATAEVLASDPDVAASIRDAVEGLLRAPDVTGAASPAR